MAASGHTDAATTQRYVDTGLVLRASFGQPHPPIPEELVREVRANTVWNTVSDASKLSKLLRPQRELKARQDSPRLPENKPNRSLDDGGESNPRPASVGQGRTGLDSGAVDADEAMLEAKLIAADLAGNETRARAYERRLEALRTAKAAGNVIDAAHMFAKKSS